MIVKIGHKPIPTYDIKDDLIQYANEVVKNEKDKEVIINFLNGKKVKSTRRLKRAFEFVYMTVLAAWIQAGIATNAYAQTTLSRAEKGVIDDIDIILFKIQLICAGICVSVAILMAMIAGFFRMLGLREEAKKRYMDAVAGMTMVLTAPAVLGVIATIVRGLIRLFPNYGA
jgi:hypothetical protein